MWEKKNKRITKYDKSTVTYVAGTAQCENETIKCEKKNKGTTECEKRTVTCDVGTVECKDEMVKCEK